MDPVIDDLTDEEDVAKEMFDGTYNRVDVVSGPASGMRFVVLKAEKTQDPEAIWKVKYTAEEQRTMLANGQAFKAPDGSPSYPIGDKADLDSAIHAVGRGGADHDAIRKYIIGRAKALGASSDIPDNWAADGSLKETTVSKTLETAPAVDPEAPAQDPAPVIKDDGTDATGNDLDVTEVLADPDDSAPGDPNDPGSPAWESIDAATARKWTSILARARTALGVMADRETLEAASADPDDIDNAMDLADAGCAIDYAISVLAPFAVDEQSEADCGTDEMELLGKAIAGLDPANLETVEALARVRKAGRTLSSANEAALRAALQSLQQVLASLPKAPAAPGDATEMTKEESPEMSDNDTAVQAALDASTPMGTPKEPASAETPAAAGMPGEVVKAGAKPDQMAVYDSDGNLIGVVDPGDVTRLMSAKAPAPVSSDDAGTDGSDETAGDMQPGDVQPTDGGTTPTDLAPAPADAVGTPADATQADDDGNVAKADTTNDTVPDTMLKSSISELVKAAVDERSAEQAGIVKQLEDRYRALEERNEALTQELAKQTASSEERFTVLENQPAVMAIASNGAIPPAHMLRGQDRGASAAGAITRAQEMRDAFKASDDATKQQAYAAGLNALAIDELSRIHAAGPR